MPPHQLTDDVQQLLQETLSLVPAIEFKLIASLLGLVLLWVLHRLILAIAYRLYQSSGSRFQARKIANHITGILGILTFGWIWFEGFQSLTTFLGLVSAGLVIALQDLLIDLAGWAFIVWRKPFEVGDRVQVGDISGDVIDIRAFQFTLMEIGNWVDADQSTGRVIHVPNGKVFREAQANYTQGFKYIWHETSVHITFESNWQKAKQILQSLVDECTDMVPDEAERHLMMAAEKYPIYYTKFTPIVYTSVREYGIQLSVRYLVEPRRRRSREQEVWERVLTAFAEHADIQFAYPTYRFYNQAVEGPQSQSIHTSTGGRNGLS